MTQQNKGFTIVELLIVVVVIAILAAITIVAYNGIRQRAQSSSVQSTVSQSLKKIQSFKVTNSEQYPTSVTACPNPGVNQLCVLDTSAGTALYAVENSVSPAAFCVSFEQNGARYYSDEAGQVLPGSCAERSCYEIQQRGGSHGDGTYWIQPTGVASPIRAYCDMTTSGGGWTLLVNNVGPTTIWTQPNTYSLNTNAPTTTVSYSILEHANEIKANISGNLNYRFDANGNGRYGGVWRAPYATNLEGTSAQNVGVNLEMYDSGAWSIDTDLSNGTSSPSNIVPWYYTGRGLTTWDGVVSGSWWGTLVTQQSSWSPTAPYISSGSGNIQSPDSIRYWVR